MLLRCMCINFMLREYILVSILNSFVVLKTIVCTAPFLERMWITTITNKYKAKLNVLCMLIIWVLRFSV